MNTPDINPENLKLIADFVERATPCMLDAGKAIFKTSANKVKLRQKSTYKQYLESASKKYGRTKSIFFQDEPSHLYDFYVPLGISLGEERIDSATYNDVIGLTTRAVVTGQAGSGKSMLMRHLFLSCIRCGKQIPIFVELRSGNDANKCIMTLIKHSLELFGFDLGDEYIQEALKLGHFAIFLDGYDEIDHSRRDSVTKELMTLSSNAQKCSILLSSRPDDIFNGWDEFSNLKINPLTIKEASKLVEMLPYDKEIKPKFLSDLHNGLFGKHLSFLSNPLLLSIMLLTYKISADIPNKLSVFYDQAFQALFQRHDANKSGYKRKRHSDLDILEFSKLFSAFCFQTYESTLYQVSRNDALSFIEKAAQWTRTNVHSEDFLEDALQSVCLLVEDGLMLVFAHRSFQEYFAAKFINDAPPNLQRDLLFKVSPRIRSDSVIKLLHEINPRLVERELLIPKLEKFFDEIGVKNKVGVSNYYNYLNKYYTTINVRPHDDKISLSLGIRTSEKNTYYYGEEIESILNLSIEKTDYNETHTTDAFIKQSNDFVLKHGTDDYEVTYDISTLSYRSVIIRDFAAIDRWAALSILEYAYSRLKELKREQINERRTLEELLMK